MFPARSSQKKNHENTIEKSTPVSPGKPANKPAHEIRLSGIRASIWKNDTDNLALVPGARVKPAIARIHPVESSTERRRRGLSGLQPHEHHFVCTAGPMERLLLYFVDNVITTGYTIRATHAVLGWGTGLAYGDASSPFNPRLRQLVNTEAAVEIVR